MDKIFYSLKANVRTILIIVFVVLLVVGSIIWGYRSSGGDTGPVKVMGNSGAVLVNPSDQPILTALNGPTPEMVSQDELKRLAEDAKAVEDAKLVADEAERLANVPKVAEPVKVAAVAKPKAVAATSTTVTQSGYCYRFPAYLIPYLSRDPLPDATNVGGNNICHNLKNGGKDHPSKNGSSKNKKGHSGGACLDWDEKPNINACYPVSSYGAMLDHFVRMNAPDAIKAHGGLSFKKF